MNTDFQQGIVSYPSDGKVQRFLAYDSGNCSLTVTTDPVVITFAHGDINYTYTESTSIQNAWVNVPAHSWLFWDLDLLTGIRTFGMTALQPIVGSVQPTSPQIGQHWFDITHRLMKVYQQGGWSIRLRVFACQITNGVITSVMNTSQFSGSQVGISAPGIESHTVVVDGNNNPIRSTGGQLITSNKAVFVAKGITDRVQLDHSTAIVRVVDNVAEFQIVRFDGHGEVTLGDYTNHETSMYAIALQHTTAGSSGSVCLQGTITTDNWSWPTVGAPLWLALGVPGELSMVDPHVANPGIYPSPVPPVARVVSPTTIYFKPGLGNIGVVGDIGESTFPYATVATNGIFRLSVPAADIANPIVVEDADPRNTDDRYPLDHTQPAASVTTIPTGSMTGSTLQDNLHIINNTFVRRSGDVMSGPLTLNADPAEDMQAATKQYVDNQQLDDLGDVNITYPTYSHTLVYNGEWVNQSITNALYLLDDVTLTNPVTGDVLVHNGIEWVNGTNPSLWYIGDRLAFTDHPLKSNVLQVTPQSTPPVELYSDLPTLINSDPIEPFNRPFWTVTEAIGGSPINRNQQQSTALVATSSLGTVFTLGRYGIEHTQYSYQYDTHSYITKRHASGQYGGYLDASTTSRMVATSPNNANPAALLTLIPGSLAYNEQQSTLYATYSYDNKFALASFTDDLSNILHFSTHVGTIPSAAATIQPVSPVSDRCIVSNPNTQLITSAYPATVYFPYEELSRVVNHVTQYNSDLTPVWSVAVTNTATSIFCMCQNFNTGVTYTTQSFLITAIDDGGTVLWRKALPFDRDIQSCCVSHSTGILYFATRTSIVAIDHMGTLLWSTDIGHTYANVYANRDASVIIECDDHSVYALSQSVHTQNEQRLRLLALNGATGDISWSREIRASRSKLLSNDGQLEYATARCVLHNASIRVTDQAVVISLLVPYRFYYPYSNQPPVDAPLSYFKSPDSCIMSLDKTGANIGQNADGYIIADDAIATTPVQNTLTDGTYTTYTCTLTVTPINVNQLTRDDAQRPEFKPDIVTDAPGIASRQQLIPSLDVVNIASFDDIILSPTAVPPPLSHTLIGTPIDGPGMIRADSDRIYLCTKEFNGMTDIWKSSQFLPYTSTDYQYGPIPDYPVGAATLYPESVRVCAHTGSYHSYSSTITINGTLWTYDGDSIYSAERQDGLSKTISMMQRAIMPNDLQSNWAYVTESFLLPGTTRSIRADTVGSLSSRTLTSFSNTIAVNYAQNWYSSSQNATSMSRLAINKCFANTTTSFALPAPNTVASGYINSATDTFDNGWSTTIATGGAGGTGAITIAPPANIQINETIPSITLTAGHEVTVVCDGTHYFTKHIKQLTLVSPHTTTTVHNGAVVLDCTYTNTFTVLAQDNTDLQIGGVGDGDVLTIILTTGGAGVGVGTSITFPSTFRWGVPGAPTIVPGSGITHRITAIYCSDLNIFLCTCASGY